MYKVLSTSNRFIAFYFIYICTALCRMGLTDENVEREWSLFGFDIVAEFTGRLKGGPLFSLSGMAKLWFLIKWFGYN